MAGSCVGNFTASLLVWAESQDSVRTQQFLKRKESRSGSNGDPSAYQPSALWLGHTGWNILLYVHRNHKGLLGTGKWGGGGSGAHRLTVILPLKPWVGGNAPSFACRLCLNLGFCLSGVCTAFSAHSVSYSHDTECCIVWMVTIGPALFVVWCLVFLIFMTSTQSWLGVLHPIDSMILIHACKKIVDSNK